jgi:Tol biopolymer transport system component/tRNA A-37 threonylcarbamoyl transferase component Bud32
MTLAPGTRLGPYEITAPLGVGGMGEVYRAHDGKLERDVAIKILPQTFAANADRVARFQREARILASLNHPNIGHIYGLEESEAATALVLELVEGPTLADRIAAGPVPIDEACAIARQICEALEAAHQHGIIHRDLKPANIKLRPDGIVKVLDFGLAKALASESSDASGVLANSPTITSPAAMTHAGVLLGTAAYMSPEQAKGKPAHQRSDMWAFGCVLYEMLAGRPAFRADDLSDTLVAVMRDEPDWLALPRETPEPIRRLLRRCLAKDPKRRLGDASGARIEIDDAKSEAPASDQRVQLRSRHRMWLTWAAALAVATLAVAGTMAWMLRPAAGPLPRLARFPIALPTGQQFTNPGHRPVVLSPDGRVIVYTANQQLFLRPIDQLEPVPIRGTVGVGPAGGRGPFFSPDGQWVGFWQGEQLKKVPIAGGAPIVLCPARNHWGASWASDNTILYGQGPEGIWRVSGDGGKPENLVKVDPGQIAAAPQLLPGGRAILFTLVSSADPETRQIVVQSLDTGVRRVVVEAGTDAQYVATGHLVYAIDGTLLAAPFDTVALTTVGGPVPLVDDVAMSPDGVLAYAAASNEGALVYVPRDAVGGQQDRTPVWVDRQGRETPIKGLPDRRYRQARLSPDGTRIAFVIQEQNTDLWIFEVARGTLTRLTVGPAGDQDPVWTPDGKSLIFSSGAPAGVGFRNLFRLAADGTGTAEQLTRDAIAVPKALTADGNALIFVENKTGSGPASGVNRGDVMLLPLVGERRPQPLVRTQFSETNAELSPDGRWLAYQSNESGQEETFVRPFPNVEAAKSLVAPGTRPLWARSGRELFYVSASALMSVPVTMGSTITFGKPGKLFDGPYVFGPMGRAYDVSADGQRFLIFRLNSQSGDSPRWAGFVIVLNWFEELKRRVPTK